MPAAIASPDWASEQLGFNTLALGVYWQVGAVLFIGCSGGKQAAALSQVAYLLLGLTFGDILGFNVFANGGGLGYIRNPSFGYLLGFIPAAWLCGTHAFRTKLQLETLGFSCLIGLCAIHLVGVMYLILGTQIGLVVLNTDTSLWTAVLRLSLFAFMPQAAIACGSAVLAYALRRIMFY